MPPKAPSKAPSGKVAPGKSTRAATSKVTTTKAGKAPPSKAVLSKAIPSEVQPGEKQAADKKLSAGTLGLGEEEKFGVSFDDASLLFSCDRKKITATSEGQALKFEEALVEQPGFSWLIYKYPLGGQYFELKCSVATGTSARYELGLTVPAKYEQDVQEWAASEAKQKQVAFWAEQRSRRCWRVPFAPKRKDMPWLRGKSAREEALSEAAADNTTPLFIDTSRNIIDTFYSYRSANVIEAKRCVMGPRLEGMTDADVQEMLRKELVSALKFGHTLYIRMTNTAASFLEKYCKPDSFPVEVFDSKHIMSVNDHEGHNFAVTDHPYAKVLRDADLECGVFVIRKGFEVVVCSWFEPDDYEGFLSESLPLEKLQAVHVYNED
jgi:hypothetical protein